MGQVNFFAEDIDFQLDKPNQTKDWVLLIIENEGLKGDTINYIFTNDEYLHKINLQYLNHDTYTDIITFNNSEQEGLLCADIFISIDRVKENARKNQTPFDNELHRVIIHGILHLAGYKDKTKEEQSVMRKKEDACLSLQN